MAARYSARYVFVMLPRMLALAAALAVSLATNIWLATRPPVVVQASATQPAQCEPARDDIAAADEAPPSIASFARVVEESKRARAAARSDQKEDSARALVDTSVMMEAQCRHARGKAVAAFRQDADGIRRFLLEDDTSTPEERARELESAASTLADVIGTEPGDARVQELAKKRIELERAARGGLKAAMQGETPDWRTALDVVIDMYRKQDAEARRILGEEKAQEVMLADVDARAGVLAIGSSLVGEPWEASASALK
jgi:hypothetical protein